jgi:branched-chain amino acid transport system substrate-binding protein
MTPERRRVLGWLGSVLMGQTALGGLAFATQPKPLYIAVNAEFGQPKSQAAQSIEKGVALAVAEINQKGGVLGRPLQVLRRDDRGLPARAISNIRELAADPDVLAVLCGRYSPVALDSVPVVNELGMIYLVPWAAADPIANNGYKPNFVFRLSMKDSWAVEAMLGHVQKRRLRRLTVSLPNTSWGRSNLAAIDAQMKRLPGVAYDIVWHNWGDTDFSALSQRIREHGSDGLFMVANESEGQHILAAVAEMRPAERPPIIAHWGITAADFNQMTGGLAHQLDLVTVQTFSFVGKQNERRASVLASANRHLNEDVRRLPGLVGFAHAYDLTYLLIQAVTRAGSTDRRRIRQALENLGSHEGLVRQYRRPFSDENHEGLSREQVFVARYATDGSLFREDSR